MKAITSVKVLFIGCLLILFFACQQEELIEQESADGQALPELSYQQEVTLTDSTQKNKVVLRFSSEKPFSKKVDFASLFRIKPIFEVPEMAGLEVNGLFKDSKETQKIATDIRVEIVSQELEENAIGLGIIHQLSESVAAKKNYVFSYTFVTYYDYVAVYSFYGCLSAYFFSKYYSWSFWNRIGPYYACTGRYVWGGDPGSYLLAAQVHYDWNTYFQIYVW